jgi:hypothetical protein
MDGVLRSTGMSVLLKGGRNTSYKEVHTQSGFPGSIPRRTSRVVSMALLTNSWKLLNCVFLVKYDVAAAGRRGKGSGGSKHLKLWGFRETPVLPGPLTASDAVGLPHPSCVEQARRERSLKSPLTL